MPSVAASSNEIPSDSRSLTAVWGGLHEYPSFAEAAKYVTQKLEELTLEKPREIYTKGPVDDFKGLLFTKFSLMQARDHVIDVMRQEYLTETSWVKPDKPIQERAVSDFLLGLKRVLVSWGFNKQQISVDIDSMNVHNDDKMVVRVVEKNSQLELEWSPAWQQWQEFMVDKEVKGLTDKFQELLGRASKGKGKGKKGPE